MARASRAVVADEYALEADSADSAYDDREQSDDDAFGSDAIAADSNLHHRLLTRTLPRARALHVDVANSKVFDGAGEKRAVFPRVDGDDCRSCEVCHASRELSLIHI